MDAHRPWLAQGDIFGNAPVLDVTMGSAGLDVAILQGPAVLLSHGCALDKAHPDGTPKMDYLQFAAIRSEQALDTQRAASLRGNRKSVHPSEAMWLGEVHPYGECYMLLSDPYFLPGAYFGLTCRQYDEAVDDGPNGPRATPVHRDSRIGRLEPQQVVLLQKKLGTFFTRRTPDIPPA